jgi:hypothetical protein
MAEARGSKGMLRPDDEEATVSDVKGKGSEETSREYGA